MERIPCKKCGALILPITAQTTGGVCMPCKKNPGGKTYGSGIGRLGELGRFLSGKMPLPASERTDWIELCTIEVNTGSLWIGDPLVANAEDGCVAEVPHGTYSVEGIGCLSQRVRTIHRIRVRLKSAQSVTVGSEIGETGTDSAMIGICDIRAFDAAVGPDSQEDIQEELEAKTQRGGFGLLTFRKYKGAVMAFLPSGDGDGSGPVLDLIAGGQRVGIYHEFFPEA
jgi:hypothetical protein